LAVKIAIWDGTLLVLTMSTSIAVGTVTSITLHWIVGIAFSPTDAKGSVAAKLVGGFLTVLSNIHVSVAIESTATIAKELFISVLVHQTWNTFSAVIARMFRAASLVNGIAS